MTDNKKNMAINDEELSKVAGGQFGFSADGKIGEGVITGKTGGVWYYVRQDNNTQWYAEYAGSGKLEVGTRVMIMRISGVVFIEPL